MIYSSTHMATVDVKGLSMGLKTDKESLMRTVCGADIQTDGAEKLKVRLQKSCLVNVWTCSGAADKLTQSSAADTFRDSVCQKNSEWTYESGK